MASVMHPLSGEMLNGKKRNGHPRQELLESFAKTLNATSHRRFKAAMRYDAVSDGDETVNYWANADALDADNANSLTVRRKAMYRSRYECGNNGFYAGIVRCHCDMLVGVGPKLRMLTGSRALNQVVEKAFYDWAQRIQLRRKLWCMAHARIGDGEAFGILQTNAAIPPDQVQLDLTLIEAEQCTTPFLPILTPGYIDGIRFDDNGNILWYDVLPSHPGGSFAGFMAATKVPPSQMLHWFKLERPGAHRSVPEMMSTLNTGASGRRWREATVGAAESAADFSVLLKTVFQPDELAAPVPFSSLDIQKRMMVALPDGWGADQMKAEHPNATYGEFNRSQVSEQARPLSMPYNVAAGDSSTYSFASGKLDTLCYRAALDVGRADCNDLVLDPLFSQWFREWTLLDPSESFTPAHQWDWPAHPVIDAVQEANAIQTKLANGTTTLRQVYSDAGQDLEDQLAIIAEDTFGEVSEENITKARQILTLKNTPQHAIQYVAQILGVQVQPQGAPANEPAEAL